MQDSPSYSALRHLRCMKTGDGVVSIGSIGETRVTGHGCPRGEERALGHRGQPPGFAWLHGELRKFSREAEPGSTHKRTSNSCIFPCRVVHQSRWTEVTNEA